MAVRRMTYHEWLRLGNASIVVVYRTRPTSCQHQNRKPFLPIGYGVAVTSMTLTHQPGVRLPVSEFFLNLIPSGF
jgi:threonine/homoserine efflux transporter RhtA